MNIYYLHLFDLNFTGGSGTFLKKICPELIKLGHHIEVFCARDYHNNDFRAISLPLDRVLTFSLQKRDSELAFDDLSISELKELTETICREISTHIHRHQRPNLLIVNHINILANVTLKIKETFNIPYIIISHGTDMDLITRNNRYRKLFSSAANQARTIFAISKYVADQIEVMFSSENIKILGGAVDKTIFYPPDKLRKKENIITFAGRLVEEKGIWVLLKAITYCENLKSLNIVGEGPLYRRIKDYVKNSQMNHNTINVLRYIPQEVLRPVLMESKVTVIPSIWQEPLGLVILESMACGTPVIGSAVGGIPEIIKNGFNGFLFQPNDAIRLAELINQILSDDGLHNHLSNNCIMHTQIQTYQEIATKLIGN